MPFKRDSLSVILDRVYANYTSLYKPLDRTPRQNLLRVLASVDAGIYHQLLGDLDFLAKQIFPDTAEGEYLREHWSSRTPPLYATSAAGEVLISGIPDRPVPAGIVFSAASGERYYTDQAYRIGADGAVVARVKSQHSGIAVNLAPGEDLNIVSAIPAGVDSRAKTAGGGITGGADAETDEEYLTRVLLALQNPSRYGKSGDWAAWAMDSSPEISAAWEFRNFGVFGAILIQVLNGTQITGVSPVDDLVSVTAYISDAAPPVPFTVRTPEIINLDPIAALPAQEDTQLNRELAENRMKACLQIAAKPGARITAGALKNAVIDGVTITDAQIKLGGSVTGIMPVTILEYPYIGVVTWE